MVYTNLCNKVNKFMSQTFSCSNYFQFNDFESVNNSPFNLKEESIRNISLVVVNILGGSLFVLGIISFSTNLLSPSLTGSIYMGSTILINYLSYRYNAHKAHCIISTISTIVIGILTIMQTLPITAL